MKSESKWGFLYMTNFNRSQLKYIWLLFVLIFSVLSYSHFRIAAAEIKHFQSKGQVKTINGLPLGVAEAVHDLNAYIDQINQSNKNSNTLAGFGYLAALLTAVFSFFLDCLNDRALNSSDPSGDWFRPEGGADIDENERQPAFHKETKEAEMNLTEKRYEFVTQQVRYFNEKILDTFSLFIKLSLSIVGGIFWLCSQEIAEKYKKIAPIIPWLIPMVGIYAVLMIVKNLMTQLGFRNAESDLIGADKLPYPSCKSLMGEMIMILAIVLVSVLSFNFFNGQIESLLIPAP